MRVTLARLMLAALIPLGACSGGDGGGGGGGQVVTPSPTPSATPIPAPTPTPATFPTPTPSSGDFFTRAAALYSTPPDIAACQPGVLQASVTANLVQTLNALRALHRLPPVSYSPADEPGAQQAALMMAANGQLSHTPPPSWLCYTSAGASTAGSSNLFGGLGQGLVFYTDEQIVAGWMTDVDNIVAESVGHRRWLIDPFLGSVAYGRVAGRYQTNNRSDAAVIKVFNLAGPSGPTGPLPDFVAYPYQDYPARFFDTRALLSFGVIVNKTSKFANANVDFSAATITVQQRGGGALPVSRIAYDNEGYGLPNNLQFFVTGLQANVYYDVTIGGVRGGTASSYSYYFRIVA